MEVTRAKSDMYGNSRHIVHCKHFIHAAEREFVPATHRYAHALERARQYGGRAYRGKDYRGGIVFTAQECEIPNFVKWAMESAEDDMRRAEDLFLTVISEGATYNDRVHLAGAPGLEPCQWSEYGEKADKIARKLGAPKATSTAKRIAMGKVHAYMLRHLKEL